MRFGGPWLLLPAGLAAIALLGVAAMLLLNQVCPRAPALLPVDGEAQAEFADGWIRYQDRGSGADAIVLLHGFNGQMGDWNAVWPGLDGCGRVVRLDIPGFGASSWRSDDFALALQVERVMAFLDTRGVQRPVLVGASMGGSLAAAIAARHPDRVAGLLLLAPSGYPDSLHYPGLFGWLVRPGPANRAGAWLARTPLYARWFPASRALQATSVTASYGAPWAEALAAIRAPTLLVWSRGDASFHAAAAVVAAIPGSRLVPVAAAAGHLLPQTRAALAARAACLLAEGLALPQVQQALQPLLASGGDL